MSGRDAAWLVVLVGIAAGTFWLANSLDDPETDNSSTPRLESGFYLRTARILGTGEDGRLLYEIESAYAEQKADDVIEFDDVRVIYTSASGVPWRLDADTAVISDDQRRLILQGHVVAIGSQGLDGEVTEIRTRYLELLPETYRAETDERVQVRIGSRSLTATGMLASLKDNRFTLKSNVSGKFVP